MTGLLGQCAGQQDQRKACRVGDRTEPLAAGNPASPATGPGRIQQGPAQLGPVKSGTRVWPEGGIQAACHEPRWPRHRGDQPELTGTGSTGGYRRVTCPDTAERGGARQEDTGSLDGIGQALYKRPLTKGAPPARHRSSCSSSCYFCLANSSEPYLNLKAGKPFLTVCSLCTDSPLDSNTWHLPDTEGCVRLFTHSGHSWEQTWDRPF